MEDREIKILVPADVVRGVHAVAVLDGENAARGELRAAMRDGGLLDDQIESGLDELAREIAAGEPGGEGDDLSDDFLFASTHEEATAAARVVFHRAYLVGVEDTLENRFPHTDLNARERRANEMADDFAEQLRAFVREKGYLDEGRA